MSLRTCLTHQFVEYIPERLEEGVLYISIQFATVVHLCACGCGMEVVTPLAPTKWQLLFDGKAVSLFPSIGNWSFDCRSPYWIERDRIRGARRWGEAEIDAGRRLDAARRARYYAGQDEGDDSPHSTTDDVDRWGGFHDGQSGAEPGRGL